MKPRPKEPRERIIVPMDLADETRLMQLVRRLHDHVGMFKVGKEVFTALGPRCVELIHSTGGQVFLDLKYHDIPNTVAGAIRAAARLGVRMLTVHASGGRRMLQAAVQASRECEAAPAVVAVSILTSLDAEELHQVGLQGSPREAVERLAKLAVEAGVDGLVCSAQEVAALRTSLGQEPLLVTPGIRPPGSSDDDQKRVATPAEAVAAGADYLVIGRPITQASDPAEVAATIVRSLPA